MKCLSFIRCTRWIPDDWNNQTNEYDVWYTHCVRSIRQCDCIACALAECFRSTHPNEMKNKLSKSTINKCQASCMCVICFHYLRYMSNEKIRGFHTFNFLVLRSVDDYSIIPHVFCVCVWLCALCLYHKDLFIFINVAKRHLAYWFKYFCTDWKSRAHATLNQTKIKTTVQSNIWLCRSL